MGEGHWLLYSLEIADHNSFSVVQQGIVTPAHSYCIYLVRRIQSKDNCTSFLTIFAHSPEQSWCDRQHSIAIIWAE